ncbi:MAG: geranylgeranyl reductase family protein [Bacteroidia bacterium]
MNHSDIVISGAGPAGLATSLFLSNAGIRHTIIDKASFPRDKICGDALSGKVVSILNKIDRNLIEEISSMKEMFAPSYGVSFFAPNGKRLDVPFASDIKKLKYAPGFIASRLDFDNFLFNKSQSPYADFHLNTSLEKVERTTGGLKLTLNKSGQKNTIDCKLLIGAEGERSITAKYLSPLTKNLNFYCAGLRVYYEGVSDCHDEGFIELHFLDNLLPGYFWIFPMTNGRTNVGIGMLSSVVSSLKVNLKKELSDIITNHPVISKRFSSAKAISPVEGWGLPLGSSRRNLSGNNFLLTGDAGSLIDPFTGEGIGNAMLSGKIASEIIREALEANRFDESLLKKYDEQIYHALGKELNLSYRMQKLATRKWLFNFVVNKALKNAALREMITSMFEDIDLREKLKKPGFYFRLLFNGK